MFGLQEKGVGGSFARRRTPTLRLEADDRRR
jgi:hypothetical protein